jgi:hypothetical protein
MIMIVIMIIVAEIVGLICYTHQFIWRYKWI